MYEKSVTIIYTPQYFGAPGGSLRPSSPILILMYNKAPLYRPARFRHFDDSVTDKNSKRYVYAYHATTKNKKRNDSGPSVRSVCTARHQKNVIMTTATRAVEVTATPYYTELVDLHVDHVAASVFPIISGALGARPQCMSICSGGDT